MYPNTGYYGQPYGQPYPSGNPYTMGTTAINSAARDITDNANANYRQIHDELIAIRMEDKNDQIAQLRTEIQQKDLAASQYAQNAYLIQQLRPTAIPAFNVPNPYANYGYGCYCNSANGC